jgi:hypothetical protein
LNEQDNTKQCSYCAETIRAQAMVCRFCGYDLRSGQPMRHPGIEQSRTEPVVQARSGVADGVKLGCGMFIVLPLLLLGGIIILLIVFGVLGGLGSHALQETCEVCVNFQGNTQCRTASGADQQTAVQTAHDNACAFLVHSKAEGFLCSQTSPTRVTCKGH